MSNWSLDTSAEEIKAEERKVALIASDVSKEEEVIALVERTAQELGGVDAVRPRLLVVAASVFTFLLCLVYILMVRILRFSAVTTNHWDLHLNGNTRGFMLC